MSEVLNENPELEVEELSEEKLSEQRVIRREKLKKLQEMGRNPFVHERFDVDAYSMDIKENFDKMEGERDAYENLRPVVFSNPAKVFTT